MGLAYSTAIEWSDWVIRLPRGDGSPLGTVIVFLVLATVVWAIFRATNVLSDKLSGLVWPIVSLLGFVLFIMLVNQVRNDETTETDVGTEILTDDAECEDALLTRCPASTDGG